MDPALTRDATMPSTSPESLVRQRCFTHGNREAAARCPECRRFFCRECVTEHDDRVICAACLAKLASHKRTARHPFHFAPHLIAATFSLLFLWLLIYSLGRVLISIPSSFHDGTVWKKTEPAS
ncbi:MAG: rhomboid family protein [Verrucomicrobiae bacterium]|nr:rhomboid family protein [Verrucomicrobiae bacterium]